MNAFGRFFGAKLAGQFRRITALLVTLSATACSGTDPLAPGVQGTLYRPDAITPMPAVLVLHGRGGMRTAWSDFAESLAESGYVALLVDYYAETGHPSGRAEIRANWPRYEAAVQRAATYVQTLPYVRKGGVGVVGFSLGGFLAVSTAGRIPDFDTVVTYYGGGTSGLGEYVSALPPVLILHGKDDVIVSFDKGTALFEAMKAAKRPVEMAVYEARHCFNCPSSVRYDPWSAADARDRTIEFLTKHLGAER